MRSPLRTHKAWTIDGDRVFYAATFRVVALDIHTGEQVWSTPDHSFNVVEALAVDAEHLFVASRSTLSALNRQTGEGLWQIKVPLHSFDIDYDVVSNHLVLTRFDAIMVVNPADGTILYSHDVSIRCGAYHYLIHDGKVYCETQVWDYLTGELLLSYPRAAHFALTPSDHPTKILLLEEGQIRAVDLQTGEEIWHYVLSKIDKEGTVAAISNIIFLGKYGYVIANDSTVRVFDPQDGQEIGWLRGSRLGGNRLKVPNEYGLATDGTNLYIFSDKSLYALGPKEE